jgi:hypothetical protein
MNRPDQSPSPLAFAVGAHGSFIVRGPPERVIRRVTMTAS